MSLIHKGVRPMYEVESHYDTDEPNPTMRNKLFEKYPSGGGRWWNKRLLNSGCGHVLDDDELVDGLRYCPNCKEWFKPEQFIEFIGENDE